MFPPDSQTEGGCSGPAAPPSSRRQALRPGEVCLCQLTPSPRCAGLPRPPLAVPHLKPLLPTAFPSRVVQPHFSPDGKLGHLGSKVPLSLPRTHAPGPTPPWVGRLVGVVTELEVGTQALPRPSGQTATEGRAGSCRPAQPRRVQVALVLQGWSSGQSRAHGPSDQRAPCCQETKQEAQVWLPTLAFGTARGSSS